MEDDLEIKVTREIVTQESSDDLGFLKVKMFATKEEMKSSDCQFITNIDEGEVYLEATEISIDAIEGIISRARENGANFVSIDFHGDHDEYDIYGLNIERASSEIVNEKRESEMIIEDAKKKARVLELEEELRKLKTELNYYEKNFNIIMSDSNFSML